MKIDLLNLYTSKDISGAGKPGHMFMCECEVPKEMKLGNIFPSFTSFCKSF